MMMDYREEIDYLLKFKDQYFTLQKDVEVLLQNKLGSPLKLSSGREFSSYENKKTSDHISISSQREAELLECYRNIVCEIPTRKIGQRVNDILALFNGAWYSKQAKIRFFRLGHYLKTGYKKGLSPHPLFDPDYYVQFNRLDGLTKNSFLHFVSIGGVAGLSPHKLFDARWYNTQYSDVAESRMNPLLHYLRFGYAEGRDPSPVFSTSYYLQTYADVRESKMNPLIHYVLHGEKEGRRTRI